MIPVCPGVVPVEALVGRNEWAAVVVQGAQAWADGFRLVLRAYWRDEPGTARSASAEGRPTTLEVLRSRPLSGGGPGQMADDGDLIPIKVRVDVGFDGHRLSNSTPWMWRPDGPRPLAGLSRWGMHGRGDSSDTIGWADGEYEIWPLPAGQVNVAVVWPIFGLGPVAVTLDGRLFGEAARRARPPWENWPDESMEAFKSKMRWFI